MTSPQHPLVTGHHRERAHHHRIGALLRAIGNAAVPHHVKLVEPFIDHDDATVVEVAAASLREEVEARSRAERESLEEAISHARAAGTSR